MLTIPSAHTLRALRPQGGTYVRGKAVCAERGATRACSSRAEQARRGCGLGSAEVQKVESDLCRSEHVWEEAGTPVRKRHDDGHENVVSIGT